METKPFHALLSLASISESQALVRTLNQRPSVHPGEDYGRLMAANYLVEAARADEKDKGMTLPKLDPKLEAASKVLAAVIKDSSIYEPASRAGAIALVGSRHRWDCCSGAKFWPVKKKSVPIGALHPTVLSERDNHYKELFGEDDNSQARKELQATYSQYQSFFAHEYPEWKTLRDKQLALFYDLNIPLVDLLRVWG